MKGERQAKTVRADGPRGGYLTVPALPDGMLSFEAQEGGWSSEGAITVAEAKIRLSIVGCGRAARIHASRLLALPEVTLVGCVDANEETARALAELALSGGQGEVRVYTDHREMLAASAPEVVAIFTPHRSHYRLAVDALQAGCHVFIEKPLSTNPQEAADIVNLARSRGKRLGVGHQYRLRPSLMEARRRILGGSIGAVRLLAATMTAPWQAAHSGPEDSWRMDPRISGGGVLSDTGEHLLDALPWLTGRKALEAAAFLSNASPGLEVVAAAIVRFEGEMLANVGISGVSPVERFEIAIYGEGGWIRATEAALETCGPEGEIESIALGESGVSVDADFFQAVREGRDPCCSGEDALETVRLLEAINRAGATGAVARIR